MLRCTVGQAIVRYLQAQHSDYDGQRRRLVPAIFGIFGHGNVAGLGQALDECGDQLTYLQGHNEQSMVHTARGVRQGDAACRHAGLHGVDWSGLYEHGHGCSRRDDQPTAGVAVPLGLLRGACPRGPCCSSWSIRKEGARQRERLLPARQSILRSDQPP